MKFSGTKRCIILICCVSVFMTDAYWSHRATGEHLAGRKAGDQAIVVTRRCPETTIEIWQMKG